MSTTIISRITPGLFNLLVALASRAARAYLLVHPEMAYAFGRSPMAISLVPPLCVVAPPSAWGTRRPLRKLADESNRSNLAWTKPCHLACVPAPPPTSDLIARWPAQSPRARGPVSQMSRNPAMSHLAWSCSVPLVPDNDSDVSL